MGLPIRISEGGREESVLARHHPVGLSTGFMADSRGDWLELIRRAADFSPFAVELSALSEAELAPLAEFLTRRERLPFDHLSVHGPSKGISQSDAELARRLEAVAVHCDGIVMHPDRMAEPERFACLGRRLLVENMDGRKASGGTAEDLERVFERLPRAGFCFDVAHACSIDPGMGLAEELLDAFGGRLREVHLSSLTADFRHVPLSERDLELFTPALARCVDVPWILEAPPGPA